MPEINLPMMLRVGVFSPQSFNDADRTVEVVWTTGATVRQRAFSWDGIKEFDEQLIVDPNSVRLERLNAGAPLLDSHNKYSLSAVIGAVVPGSARLVNGQGLARIQLSRAEADAAVVQKIADGIIRNISAGYRIHRVERVEQQDGKPPLMRVTDWEPFEISAVTAGADPGAAVRSEEHRGFFPCLVSGQADNGNERALVAHAAALRMRMKQRQLGRLL
jgi:hypothetical protein